MKKEIQEINLSGIKCEKCDWVGVAWPNWSVSAHKCPMCKGKVKESNQIFDGIYCDLEGEKNG